MAEWISDLTEFDLDTSALVDNELLTSLVDETAENNQEAAFTDFGDAELGFLESICQSSENDALLAPATKDAAHGSPASPHDQSISSPSEDGTWASSKTTPEHVSPQLSVEDGHCSRESAPSENERKRKADSGDSNDESFLQLGAIDFTDEAVVENGYLYGQKIRPEDDPYGLFQRDPMTLTPDEMKLLKKQKRLIKNRESAQLSRHRKKLHQETLESQVIALEKEKQLLNARLEQLAVENTILKNQLILQGKIPASAATAATSAPAVPTPASVAAKPVLLPQPVPVGRIVIARPTAPTATPSAATMRPVQGTVLLGVLFASAIFMGTDLPRTGRPSYSGLLGPSQLPSGAAASSSRGAAAAALGPYFGAAPSPPSSAHVGGARPRGRVLLAAAAGGDAVSEDGKALLARSVEAEPVGGAGSLLADRKQLLIVTLLDHIVGQLHHGGSGSGSGAGSAAVGGTMPMLGRLCGRLVELGVLDSCGFVDALGAVRREYAHAFQAFNLEFSRVAAEAAEAASGGSSSSGAEGNAGKASVNAEFVFANGGLGDGAVAAAAAAANRIDAGRLMVPLPPALPRAPALGSPAAADEDAAAAAARLAARVTASGGEGDISLVCPSAQLLISDVPANAPKSDEPRGKRAGVGERLTRLQREVAAARAAEGGNNASLAEEEREASSADVVVAAGDRKPVARRGGVSVVVPRRALEAAGGRLPAGWAAVAAAASPLVELQCASYEVRPLGLPGALLA